MKQKLWIRLSISSMKMRLWITLYLTQSHNADPRPTIPNTDPITLDVWQGNITKSLALLGQDSNPSLPHSNRATKPLGHSRWNRFEILQRW